jgi:hypothetical protein
MTRKENTKEKTVTTNTQTEPNFEDVDVDAPVAIETEDTVAETPAKEEKAKEPKAPARPPVPEGKVSPVHFAKILSKHLTERDGEERTVAPQVVYSYIKNNGPESKNPFPAEKAEGRAAVVDAEAGLKWWDDKDARVKASKASKAEKDAKKAEKADKGEAPSTEAPAAIEEAE